MSTSEDSGDFAVPNRPVVLIGFMGAGKSSIGKKLASRLHRPFFDVDSVIEQKEHQSIDQLFLHHGEAHFRHLEQTVIADLMAEGPAIVLALGGGAYETASTRELLEKEAIVVYLEVDWSDIARFLPSLRSGRPVLSGLGDDEVRALFERRSVTYSLAPVVVHIHRSGVKNAAETVHRALERYGSL